MASTIEPVTTDGWYENHDGTFSYYVWNNGATKAYRTVDAGADRPTFAEMLREDADLEEAEMKRRQGRFAPGFSGSLRTGEQPPKGYCVTLCRSNYGGAATQVEWFESDGEWVCPETVNGFFYRAESPEAIENSLAQYAV